MGAGVWVKDDGDWVKRVYSFRVVWRREDIYYSQVVLADPDNPHQPPPRYLGVENP